MRRNLMMRSRSETEGWLRDTLKGGDSMDGKRLKGLASDSGIKERFIERPKLSAWSRCPVVLGSPVDGICALCLNKGCHVCLTKTKADIGEVGRHGEPRPVAKAEPTESKLKEARGTAKLAIHPSVNAAMVIEKFGGARRRRYRRGQCAVGEMMERTYHGVICDVSCWCY
jgi:hypothetical protein